MTFQSADDSDISVITQNKKCFDNDIVCSKSVLISAGDTEIYLNDTPYKEVSEFFYFRIILTCPEDTDNKIEIIWSIFLCK